MFDKESLKKDGFDWQSALNLAMASRLAYKEETYIEGKAMEWGFDGCQFFNERPSWGVDTQGFVAWDGSIVVVSFRGSESLADWVTNLTLLPKEGNYGHMHKGFYEAYKAAEGRINNILESARANEKKIWVTGHSLGGALAVVMCAEQHPSRAITGLYTYGQPKVAKDDTKDKLNEIYSGSFFRFVNENDIVARIPPFFSHAGKLYSLIAEGGVSIVRSDTDFGELTKAEFDALVEEWSKPEVKERVNYQANLEPGENLVQGAVIAGVEAHSISHYVTKIANELPSPE